MSSFFKRMQQVAAAITLGFAASAQAATIYSLAGGGNRLIRFDSANPGAVTVVGALTVRLDGLDFRPSNGLLYGYSDVTNGVYTVNTATAAITLVSALNNPTNTSILGIDFNPVPDRLRIVTSADDNLRVNVATGGTTVDTSLAYAAGDVRAGMPPSIIDAAYTNSDTNPNTGTQLYYLDFAADTLVSTSNPNFGVLNTVGMLGVDINPSTGFDILTVSGVNTAYAQFRVGGVNGLYTINLGTGAASLIGAIGDNTSLYGLAVAPAAVPAPASLALVALGGLAGLVSRRRRIRCR